MTRERREFRFRIDAYTPQDLPMARLAEYMADLARLMGTPERVHFVRLEEGSTVLVENVEWEAVPKVRERIRLSVTPEAEKEAREAYEAIDRRLAEDNAVGELAEARIGKVIEFKGRERAKPQVYGPFTQEATLYGVLIAVGGKNDPVPVHLEYGDQIYNCLARRDLARSIAVHLFGPVLRVTGSGRWKREADGKWHMSRFTISDFEKMDQSSLSEAVRKLRSIGGPLAALDDPIRELLDLRKGNDSIN